VGTGGLEQLRAEMQRCPYHEFLRPKAVSVDPGTGTVVVRLPYRPEFRLAYDSDFFHGGVLAALVDITGHAAVAITTGRVAPTIDLRIDYMKRAGGPELLASGRVLGSGRSIARADVEVCDVNGTPVVQGRGTYSTL
jgi:uncharacterized protein (TIGR00369 family)